MAAAAAAAAAAGAACWCFASSPFQRVAPAARLWLLLCWLLLLRLPLRSLRDRCCCCRCGRCHANCMVLLQASCSPASQGCGECWRSQRQRRDSAAPGAFLHRDFSSPPPRDSAHARQRAVDWQRRAGHRDGLHHRRGTTARASSTQSERSRADTRARRPRWAAQSLPRKAPLQSIPPSIAPPQHTGRAREVLAV